MNEGPWSGPGYRLGAGSSTRVITQPEQAASRSNAATAPQLPTRKLATIPSLKPEDFTVAFICALPLELDAILRILDSSVTILPHTNEETHIFMGGKMAGHTVALTLPKQHGKLDATLAAEKIAPKFPNLRLTLLVGICGGIPTAEDDVRLGDVIISSWVGRYAFAARWESNNLEIRDILQTRTDVHVKLQQSLKMLKSQVLSKGFYTMSAKYFEELQREESAYQDPQAPDMLFPLSYPHVHRPPLQDCGCDLEKKDQCDRAETTACGELGCQQENATLRERQGFKIHTGGFGSEDIVMRGNAWRDELGNRGILGLDMEASGIIHLKGALVIKGVSDYADTHKTKEWQHFAAGTAACVAKAFITHFYPHEECDMYWNHDCTHPEPSSSHLEDILGIGASIIAVVDACNKLIDRTKKFRGSAASVSLRSRLQLFSSNVKSLDKITSTGIAFNEEEQLLRDVLQGCKDTIEELDSLLTSLLPEINASALKKTRQAVRASLQDNRVSTILEELQEHQNTILFYLSSKAGQNTRKAVFLVKKQKMILQMEQVSMNRDAVSSRTTQDSSSALDRRQQKHVPGEISCIFKDCRCFCHRQPHADGFTEYSAGISTCRCKGVQYSLRMPILRKLFQVSLAASWSNGLSVAWSIKSRNVVRENNEGFETIRNCGYQDGITFEQARERLLALRDLRLIDFNDTAEDGVGYLETLCNSGRSGEEYVKLARFLAEEGVYWKLQDHVTSTINAVWPFLKGPDLDLMRALPPIDEFSVCWYQDLYHSPRSTEFDPFFIRAFTQICLAQIDIGDYRPLHVAVATNAVDEVKRLVKAQGRPDLTQNFLGHTVLHLAIQWPGILEVLLENGYHDIVDSKGGGEVTPLFCALCYGCTKSIDILVNAGALLSRIEDGSVTKLWWAFSAAACDEEPFIRLMEHYIRNVRPTRIQSDVLEPLIFTETSSGPWNVRAATRLVVEVEKWSESYPYDFRRRGETPLHIATTPEHARVLMSYDGFDINSSSEKYGETPLMIYSWFLDSELIQETLARGAKVNSTDRWGRNALHYTFSRIFSCQAGCALTFHKEKLTSVIGVATVLVVAGGDMFQRDKCRCYCSPKGCSPLRFFVPAKPFKGDHRMIQIWILELFVVLQSCGKSGICDLLIGELGRLQRADEVGITHTCCTSKFSKLVEWDIPVKPSYLIPNEEELEKSNNDWKEIQEEECDLGSQLDQRCLEDLGTSAESWESRFVSILARRWVMMDTIDEARRRRSVNSDEKGKKQLNLEGYVEKYMSSMEDAENYLADILPKYDHKYWMTERKRISQLLLEEVRFVRGEIDIEKDWDIENWVEGAAMKGFEVDGFSQNTWLTFMPIGRI